MHDAALVRRSQSIGDLRAEIEGFADRDRPALMRVRRSIPSMYSMTMKGVPSSVPTSWMVTMLGWLSAEAERASWVNRVRVSRAPVMRSGRSLIATLRPSLGSRAT